MTERLSGALFTIWDAAVGVDREVEGAVKVVSAEVAKLQKMIGGAPRRGNRELAEATYRESRARGRSVKEAIFDASIAGGLSPGYIRNNKRAWGWDS